MGRIVQLLGAAPNISKLPDVPGAERWACNNPRVYRVRGSEVLSTWARWFNMHSFEHIMKTYRPGFEWYAKQDGSRPIYFRDGAHPRVPGSLEFPGRMLMDFFGEDEDAFGPEEEEGFFTFSGSWMMAKAIHEHLTGNPIGRIELWGIMMRRESQYDFERPCMHYWIGRARQAGIRVLIPPNVDLCKAPKLYGYETVEPIRVI